MDFKPNPGQTVAFGQVQINMATETNNWTRAQLLIAFNLYCQMPFGKMHKGNPDIIRFAKLIGRTPDALAMKLTNIASLDSAITSTGRKGLSGASKTDRVMWDEMQLHWEEFALQSQAAVDALIESSGLVFAESLATQMEAKDEEGQNYSAENRTSQVQVRVGQHFFRRSVISAYQGRCCMTGLAHPQLLVASHIVPWRADKNNRLNPRNGLCLSVLHDRAFDQGLITLTMDYKIRTSKEIKAMDNPFAAAWLIGLEGKAIELPEKFRPEHKFIEWHNKNIFLNA